MEVVTKLLAPEALYYQFFIQIWRSMLAILPKHGRILFGSRQTLCDTSKFVSDFSRMSCSYSFGTSRRK